MILELTLPAEMWQRLDQGATRSGLRTEAIALRLLDQHLAPLDERHRAAVVMLEQWMAEDANLSTEEAASNAEVLRRLDNDRPSHRKPFAELSSEVPR